MTTILPIQDRTNEFRSCVTWVSKQNSTGAARGQVAPAKRTARSEFASQASEIASEIAQTTAMLERLTTLAKRRTLFDDKPVEITQLTYVIKHKVSKLNDSIGALQKSTKSASARSSKAKAQLSEHSKNVLVMLQDKLSQVTTGFAEVLELRTQNIQASKSRGEQFLSTSMSAAASAVVPMEKRNAANPLTSSGSSNITSSPLYAENPYTDDSGANARQTDDLLMLPDQEQAMVLLEEQQNEYLSSRSSAVEAIERTIQELGGIFSQLATMVAEQRETVQRIDANSLDIADNVSGAQRELLKYFATVSSNRWLMLKMFGVVLVFFFLWVLVS